MNHLTRFALLIMVGLTCLAACSDEEVGGEWPEPLVRVVMAPGFEPVTGIKVVVMDPDTNTPAAVPVTSDLNGECEFPGLGSGNYNLLVFGGAVYEVIDLGGSWNVYGKGMSGPASFADPVKTEPAPLVPVVQVGMRRTPGGLPRISGQVVDAVTGQPLAAAFVSTSPYLSGYTGGTTVKDDVTLADGMFSVSEIAFAQDPDTGNLVQVEPLMVSCAGYIPLSWRHQPPHGDDNTDITGVSIALEPADGAPTGSLSGRLLLDGEPAGGVRVGLGGVGADKSGAGQPGYIGWTGQDGRFLFPNLPAGSYFIHAGFLPHDGIVYPNQAGNVARTVVPDQETATGDLILMHEVALVYPPNGWDYLGPEWMEPLLWVEVPGATQYTVFLDGAFLAQTLTNSFDLPEDLELNPGGHRWYVLAYDGDEAVVGATEVPGIFYIIPTP